MGRLYRWLIVLALLQPALALDRCIALKADVRREHERVFGLNYPWHYSLGQLKQESHCRADIVAFDGGQGAAQFMPATTAALSKRYNYPFDPFKLADATRLQAIFLSDILKSCPAPALWVMYQAYNGGCKLLKVEQQRAGSWNHDLMLLQCHRKILTLKNGSKLDLCKVNYDYPVLIHKYGDAYRTGPDKIQFWSIK